MIDHPRIYTLLLTTLVSHFSFLADRAISADDTLEASLPRKVVMVGERKGFIILPKNPATDGSKPWVWYAPTIGGHPNRANEWAFRPLVEKGFAVCGIDVGESYGSPAGRKVFTDFYEKLRRDYQLDTKVSLIAQSRGGLMHYNWAADNPEKVRSIVGIYPVCDLRSYPGLMKAAPAYEMSADQLEQKLVEHNPIDRLAPLAKAGVPILHLHGDSDNVVPLERNSQVIYDRYRARGGQMELIVVPGKGHAEIPEFFQSQRMVEFLLRGK